MKCPVCNSEIPDNSVSCDKCGAIRSTRRTPLGVVVGWVGMTVAMLWAMLWLFLFALLLVGHDVGNFPWTTLVLGTLLATGLLWYSRTTLHAEWGPRNK
mgnify:CR=1 FL=1